MTKEIKTEFHLKDKVVIITGASSGIGRATVIAFAREGANVVLAARNRDALLKIEEEIQPFHVETLIVPTDVTEREKVKYLIDETVKNFGRIDILIGNAGLYFRCPVPNLKIEDIERVMAVNFYGCLYGIFEVLPHMFEKKAGHIVVISSVEGKKGLPLGAAYVASKFAITGFTEALRQELRGTGIHVSTIFPAYVDTPMIADLIVPKISGKIPPERVANAIIRAVLKKKTEVVIPYLRAKIFVCLNSISPLVGDWIVRFFHLNGRNFESRTL